MSETLVSPQTSALVTTEDGSIEEAETYQIAQRMVELVCQVLNCKRVAITKIDPQTHEAHPLVAVGLSAEQEQQWWASVLSSYLQSRLEQGKEKVTTWLHADGVLILDAEQLGLRERLTPYEVRTILSVPVYIGEQLIGILSLDYGENEHHYTSEEISLAIAVSRLLAVVIERERLMKDRAEAIAQELALRVANQRMDEFLGIASHELKTPLTVVKGNIQLAKLRLNGHLRDISKEVDSLRSKLEEMQRALEGKPGEVRDLLERAERHVGIQSRMVSNMLDISRIQSNQLELDVQECDLVGIANEAVEDQRMMFPQRSIQTKLPEHAEVSVLADADRIRQAINNYLTNALKYSPPDRPVLLRLTLEGERARLAVRDEGPGLEPEEQEQVWNRFYRAQGIVAKSNAGGGLGLGLHICRMIVEAHGGEVGVESTVGKGSTFWFTMPLARHQLTS